MTEPGPSFQGLKKEREREMRQEKRKKKRERQREAGGRRELPVRVVLRPPLTSLALPMVVMTRSNKSTNTNNDNIESFNN